MNEQPRRWLQLLWLSVCNLLAMTLWFAVTAVTPALEQVWRLTPLDKAWLTMSVQLGFAVGALISAVWNLADRYPGPVLIGLAALTGATLNGLIACVSNDFAGTATGFGIILLLRAVIGALLALVYPVGMRLTASWFRQGRGLAIGMMVGALTVGSGGPHLLRALPLDQWLSQLWQTGTPLPETWRLVLWSASGLAFCGGILALAFIRTGPWLPGASQFDWSYFVRLWQDEPLRRANFGYLGHMFELYAMWTWMPLLLKDGFQAAAGQTDAAARNASLVAFASVALGGFGCVAAGFLAERRGRCFTTIVSLVMSGACALVAGILLPWPFMLATVCIVWGITVIADSAQFSAAVSELCDPRYVGTALAIQTSTGFLLTTVTIAALPMVQESLGWPLATAVLALGPVVGIWHMALLRRMPEAEKLAAGKR